MTSSGKGPGTRSLAIFFAPLALQAVSQSVSYPIMAMVASRGDGGAVNLAGLAQANAVLFLILAIGAGLQTTGMVFAKTREGMAGFKVVNRACMLVILAVQLLLCIPSLAHLVFGVMMGLDPLMENAAYKAFLTSVPLSVMFNLRNPCLVVLYNGKRTGLAYWATLARIFLTAVLALIFCDQGLVGPVWAVVCQLLAVAVEAIALEIFAAPLMAALPSIPAPGPIISEMFMFSCTFSMGSGMVALSGFLVGAFAARGPSPDISLPVYYAVIGLVNPASFAATRLQSTYLAFADGQDSSWRWMMRFALGCGVLLGLAPLIFCVPGICEWYYVGLQQLPESSLWLVRETSLCLILTPLAVGIRACAEGRAAMSRRPRIAAMGQVSYLSAVSLAGMFALWVGAPGNLIGPFAVLLGNLCSASLISAGLSLIDDRKS